MVEHMAMEVLFNGHKTWINNKKCESPVVAASLKLVTRK